MKEGYISVISLQNNLSFFIRASCSLSEYLD